LKDVITSKTSQGLKGGASRFLARVSLLHRNHRQRAKSGSDIREPARAAELHGLPDPLQKLGVDVGCCGQTQESTADISRE
jgi:hypothetical protein